MYRYYKKIGNTDPISSWKSKELSDETIKLLTTSYNNLAPVLSYTGNKTNSKHINFLWNKFVELCRQ